MARKKAVATTNSNTNGVTEPSTSAIDASASVNYDSQAAVVGASVGSAPRLDVLGTTAGVKRDAVKVNNASLTELKNACDDAVKTVCLLFVSIFRLHVCL